MQLVVPIGVRQIGYTKRYQAAVAGAVQKMLSQTARSRCTRQVTTETPHTELQ